MTVRACAGFLGLLTAGCADPSAVRPTPRGPATLLLGGDAMLARGIEAEVVADPQAPLFEGFEAEIAEADIVAVNLETTITTATAPWEGKNYHFRLDPSAAEVVLARLPGARRFVSNANNHILDYLPAGLTETIETLDARGIPHAGAGQSFDEAAAPRILELDDGVRVGFVAAATVCSCGSALGWLAGDGTPGMFQFTPADPGSVLDAVDELRPQVDWLVLSLHWGENYLEQGPPAWMRELAATFAEHGADVIVGHSSHHILPVERIGDAVVVYGPGDFIDDYGPRDGFRNDLSLAAEVALRPGAAPELDVIPLRIDHGDRHVTRRLSDDDPDVALVFEAAGWP